jgi:hypothetical protein
MLPSLTNMQGTPYEIIQLIQAVFYASLIALRE